MLSIFIGVSIREVMGDGPPHIFGQEGMREGAVRGRAKDPKTPAPKHSMVDNGDIITFICIIHFSRERSEANSVYSVKPNRVWHFSAHIDPYSCTEKEGGNWEGTKRAGKDIEGLEGKREGNKEEKGRKLKGTIMEKWRRNEPPRF